MSIESIHKAVTRCTRCPRLRQHCRKIAREKRRQYRDWTYWGKPVPSFGDPRAKVLIVGLAPAAHGANRTGRMFTGDNSGAWLYRALFEAGLANQATSSDKNDGLTLRGVLVSASAHCAPPDNKPTRQELENCFPFLVREYKTLQPRVVLATGGIAFRTALNLLRTVGVPLPKPQPKFGHGVEYPLDNDVVLMGTYHPSQQNTFTGRLTQPMLRKVMVRAAKRAGLD